MDEEQRFKEYKESVKNMFGNNIRSRNTDTFIKKEIMVQMRDGVKLRTIIYLPDGKGPFPTLFTRTPYAGFDKMLGVSGEEYAQRGYAYVIQYCRGTGGSEGEWVPNDNERNDGKDSVNWLSCEEWVKSIGIHGVSYMALTGWIIADELPDKVKAFYLCHYSVDRYLSAYRDGLFRHDILTGWALANISKGVQENFYDLYIESSLYRPHIGVDEALWGQRVDWYRDWITNTDKESEYWNAGTWRTLKDIPEKIKKPVCVVAGWYDHHLEGTLLGFEKLNPENKKQSKLVVGGWDHDLRQCVPAHNPQNAQINTMKLMFDWFDRIMVEELDPDTSISTYFIGEDKWKNWDSWPIKNDGIAEAYISANRSEATNSYTLSFDKDEESKAIEYDYNPEHPVRTCGGETTFISSKERGSVLQNSPSYREDVISFISEQLKENVYIAGKMNVKLYVSSDCEDTCFTAKIMEVLPNGEAYNIRSSITTLAYRNNEAARKSYIPDAIVEINIDMLPITWCIRKGSKIRVDISSSNFPEFAVHTNYPGIWSLQKKTKIAHQSLYCGGNYISKIQIPYRNE